MKRNMPSPMSTNSVSMPTPSESMYSYTIARSQQPQDLTPYSAVSQVSSFNQPAYADANLVTPVSLTSSPHLPLKTESGLDIKLSPNLISPSYDLFGGMDEEDFSPRYNGPMKHKAAYPQLHTNGSASSLGPDSESFCASPPHVPYYGSFGVSAPRVSRSPSSAQMSPQLQSAGSSNSNHHYQSTSLQTSASFRSAQQAPILIAPNPLSLRQTASPYTPHSLTRSPPSQTLQHAAFSPTPSSPASQQQRGGKKGSKKGEPSFNDYQTIMAVPELRSELTEQELLILELRYKDNLQWKEVAAAYTRKNNKKTNVAALQMRRRRLMEKLWEKSCEISITTKDSAHWDVIRDQFQKYAPQKTSKDIGQRKWHDMNESYESNDFSRELQSRHRERQSSDFKVELYSNESWSEEDRASIGHSLDHSDSGLLSQLSSATMDDTRSRMSSDASMKAHLQQQDRVESQQRFRQQRQQQQQAHQYQGTLYSHDRQGAWDGLPQH